MNRVVMLLFLALALDATGADSLRAEEPAKEADTAEGIQFFENKVRPILVQNCHKCHSDKKQEGMLRLDAKGAMLGRCKVGVDAGNWSGGKRVNLFL